MIFIGLDDTDNLESRGTGHLARSLAQSLAASFPVLGVTRHQLLQDPRVPCTKRNSCAAILLQARQQALDAIVEIVRTQVLQAAQPGSDPGICISANVPPSLIAFGRLVQSQLVQQQMAREVAQAAHVHLEGLGGDEDGVIGALAAVGLRASGEDGRFVQVGSIRQLAGLQPVKAVLAAGVHAIHTETGETVQRGKILCDKLRPAHRGGQPIAIVRKTPNHWQPLKLD